MNKTSLNPTLYLLALLFSLFLIAGNVYIYHQQRDSLLTAFKHAQQNELQILSQLAKESLITENYALIEWFFNRWGEDRDEVLSLTLENSSGFALTDYRRPLAASGETHSSSRTITSHDDTYLLTLTSETNKISHQLSQLMQQLFLVSSIAILLLAVSIWFLFQRLAIRPLLREIKIRHKAEQALIKSSTEWTFAMDFFEDAIYLVDLDDKLVRANRTFYSMTGLTPELAIGQDIGTIIHPQGEKTPCPVCKARTERRDEVIVMEPNDPDNPTGKPIRVTVQMIRDGDSSPSGVLMGIRDLSKFRDAEKEKAHLLNELHQSQKMDALGNLTGGIAHDFNNILGIIMGNVELAQNNFGNVDESKIHKYLSTIKSASERARDLVAQMMLFSRRDQQETHPMDLAPMIKEDVKMLRALLPSSIEIDLNYQSDLPKVDMEPVKLQKILMNLCLNAKDSMNGIGKLTIRLGMKTDVDEECSSCKQRLDGDWVELSVADTGSGIATEVLAHIYEPFFTTKDVGKGTGMGLAVIDSTVKSLGGHTIVQSKVGHGTTFSLLFRPSQSNSTSLGSAENSSITIPRGSDQSILIVDDEPALAQVISEMLDLYQYRSTAMISSIDAMKLFESKPDAFELVITDQTMPQLTGIEMASRMHEIRPELPIILTTGYSESVGQKEADEQGIGFIHKPVKVDELAKMVAGLLQRSK
ncbi:MAG: response regulator [Gammaproteobacteria bacterium]|nr:response regulator [Gammaproteobacteria bacterium]